jgi:AcrR family transcriptional regulator
MGAASSTRHRSALPNAAQHRAAASATGRRGTGRTSRGRDTRQRLVGAARTVFERDGFLHARIADICTEAGIAQPSFYTYFVSKEEIFDEVVSSVDLDMLSMPGRGSSMESTARVRAANRHYLDFYRNNAGILAVIDQVATFDDRVHATRADRHERFARTLERSIRGLQDEGLADRRLDPYFAGKALGGMVTAMASHLFVHPAQKRSEDSSPEWRPDSPIGDAALDDAVEQLTLLWVNALGVAVSDPSR